MAKARRKESVKLLGVTRRKRAALLMSTALQATVVIVVAVPGFTSPAVAQPAPNALPTNGAVVAGAATLNQSGNTLLIRQSSARAALTFQSYNVGSGAQVVYQQRVNGVLDSNAVALNRVTGPDPSQIAGHIEANGHIVLMNQAGVTFLKGAQVNTNGLMVTAASMSDGAMKGYVNTGTMNFDRAANPNARVDNQGNITVKQAGLAALVAPSVANSGTITARLGHVVMAGGTQTTLDMYGDGLVSINVSKNVTTVPTGPDGKPVTALVTNSGVIRADGGTVQLTAREADGVVTTLVDAGGKISANSIGGRTGTITLNGVGGGIVIDGQVSAAGHMAGTTGGAVEANATGTVTVAPTARIDASGKAGGGTVALGTTLARAKGGPSVTPTLTAAAVQVQKGAVIHADATAKGTGGRVTVLSKNVTQMNGLLTAKGGPQGGDGGFVEVSGGSLSLNSGSLDVSAPLGQSGTVLFDPDNLTIVASGGNIDGTFNGTLLAGDNPGATDSLSSSVLNGVAGNVTLQAANTIDIGSSFTIGSGGLTMQAGNFLQIGSGVTVAARDNILAQTTASGVGIDILGLLTSTSGSVSLQSAAGSQITLGNLGTVSVPTAGQSIVLQTDKLQLTNLSTLLVPSGTLEIAPTTSNTAIFLGTISSAGTLGLESSFSSLSQIGASVLRLGATTFNNVMTTTASSITFGTNVDLTGIASTLDLQTTGGVSAANNAVLTVGTLTGSATGGLNLATNGGYDTISTIGSFDANAAAGAFLIDLAGAATISGPLSGHDMTIQGSTDVSITGSVNAPGSFYFFTPGSLTSSGTITSGYVALQADSGYAITGGQIGQAGALVILNAGGTVTENSGAAIIAGTLHTGGGINDLTLSGTANAIDSIDTLFAGANVTLVDSSALTVTNGVSAGGTILLQDSNAGGITVAAAGKLNAPQDISLTTNGAGTLAINGNVSAAAVALTAGGAALSQGASSTITGTSSVAATGTALTLAGTITDGGSTPGTGTVTLKATGPGAAGTIDATSGVIVAGTLTGSATGAVTTSGANAVANLGSFSAASFELTNTANQSLSVFGPVTATNDISLTVTGNSGITATGSIIAQNGTLALNAGSLGIALNTGHVLSGTVVDLSAADGGVTQVATGGSIVASTLQSSGGFGGTGTVSLLGTSNAIDTLGDFAVTGSGDFYLVDHSALNVPGTLSVAGTSAGIYLQSAGSIGIGATGAILAPGGVSTYASFRTDSFGIASGGTVQTGRYVALAPETQGGTVTLGATGAGLSLVSPAGISTNHLLIGAVTPAGSAAGTTTITAGAIDVANTFDASGLAYLELAATGAVTQSAPVIGDTGLIGLAGSLVLLNSGNSFGDIPFLNATSGDVQLFDGSSPTLGTISAGSGNIYVATSSSAGITLAAAANLSANGTIGLQADNLASGGGFTSASNVFELAPFSSGTVVSLGATGGAGTLSLASLSGISAGTLRFGAIHAPGTFETTAGSIVVGGAFGNTSTALELDSNGGIDGSAGALSAGTLTGSALGDVLLTNSGNDILKLGDFSTSGNFSLTDPTQLIVVGVVAAGSTFASAPNPLNLKTLTIDASASGGGITLGVTSGAAGVLNSGSVALSGNLGVNEPNGTIIANAMSVASSNGVVDVSNTANNVTTVNGASANGNLTLVFDPTTTLTGTYSGSNVFLGVAHAGDGLQLGSGAVGATITATAVSNPRISLVADQITEGAAASTVTATNGTVEIASFTSATPISLAGTATSGTLLLDSTLLGNINTGSGSLVVGRYTDVPNGGTLARTGGAISVDGAVNLTGGQAQTLLLDSNGTISEPGGPLSVNTLTGTAVSVGLTNTANAVTNLGSFGDTQDFTLHDNTALNVLGTVAAGTNITLAVLNGGSLAIGNNTGTVGVLNAGSTMSLSTTGSIIEDPANGTIIAATLLGPTGTASAASGASLLSSGNTITTLGDFFTDATTGSFQLLDTHALTVLGTVAAGNTLSLAETGSGNISIGNSTTAGLLNAGTTGGVTLLSTGTIAEDLSKGTIIAKVLSGPTTAPSAAAVATLTDTANQVGTLGTFLTVNDFQFRNSIPLTLAGLVQPSAGNVFIQETAGNGLTFNGGSVIVAGQTIGLIADSLSFTSGTIDAGLGTGGTVEIAPTTSGTAVGLGGGSGLVLSTAALGAISANELTIGSYHDRPNANAQTVSAGGIDIAGNVGFTTVNRLRLDSTGAVTESTGTLSVGTLVGTASNGYALTGTANNAIGTLGATGASGTLTATSGSIEILDSTGMSVQNAASAPAGNIFLQEGAGQTLSVLGGTSMLVSGGTIGLVTDLLSVASTASIAAGTGTVEIAPVTSGSTVSLNPGGAVTGLVIDSNALGAIQASWLRIGGYHNLPGGGTNTVTAGSIDIAGLVNLGSSVVPALRLDSIGPISESGGLLNVQTLSVSTNGSVADVTLGNLNNVATLDNMTVGGNLDLADGAPILTVPTNAVVYGNNVTIGNTGSVLVLGDLGAAAGTLSLSAGTDMTVGGTATAVTLIGASGAATLTATDAFNQLGGLINANGVSITAGTTLTQSAGTIINVGTTAGVAGLVINGGSQFVQNASGTIASNNDGLISTGASGSIAASGTILTAGSLALIANTFTQNAGTIAAGGDLTVEGSALGAPIGGNILQAGGTLGAGQTLALIGNFTNSDASQTGGVLAGNAIQITSATEGSPFQTFAPAVVVSAGANTSVACACTGLVTDYVNPSPAAPGSTPSLPTLTASGASRPHHLLLDVIDSSTPTLGTFTLSQSIGADWVEIHTSGAFSEAAGGTITATLLSGSSGYAPTGSGPGATFTTPFSGVVSNATFDNGNSITDLGPFLASGDFLLLNANSVAVVGSVVAGGTTGGHGLALLAPEITVDQSGSVTTPNGLSITANGSLQAAAAIASGTVIPGAIDLLTGTLALIPFAANGTVVNAPDGFVGIGPQTLGDNIALDGAGTVSSAGTLVLTQALLNAINTLGTSAGTEATETLGLTTFGTGRIDINTGIVLPGSGANGIARNLVLLGTAAVQENTGGSLSVISLAGSADSFSLTNGNTIAELGNVATRTVGGTTYVTKIASGTLGTGFFNLVANGNAAVNDASGTLTVVGTVSANAAGTLSSGTIALTAPTMEIIAGNATLSTGTIVSAGSLLATAGTVSSGTITPSRIMLTADGLRIIGTADTPIVSAPSGLVAIAPMQGRVMSIDATGTLGGSTLSLGTSDLALIDTMFGKLLTGITPGPTGTQTLALGSVDDGVTTTATGININTPVTLGGTANLTGNTLALYSSGDVVETPVGASPTASVTVNTLIGTVTAGNIYLNGANGFTNIGNLGTQGGITTPTPVNAGLTAAAGNILIRNDQSLNVVTLAQAGSASPNYAEIDVLGGGDLTVLNGGSVAANDIYLRAGDSATSGNVTIQAGGSVLANSNADLAAGVQYIAATPTSAPSHAYTLAAGGTVVGNVEIDGYVHAGTTGTIGLYAHDSINELGIIQGGVLTGFAGRFAKLPGAGYPTANLIADLSDFTTQDGFLLRDGEALAVVGNGVTDATTGVTIAVAPSSTADLALAAPVTANAGTVKLEATGNVYETGAGTISNSAGTFVVTGGMISAPTLVSQAGAIPDTELTGNAPGTIPGTTFGRAIDWFGGNNSVATLGNVTATGNFLLNDTQSLTVAGTVVAGTLPTSTGTLATAYPVISGPFGTTPASTPAPFGEIDVGNGGSLTIASGATMHVGLDGSVTGNVILRAGDATTAGAVTVNGDVFAANGGTVAISAGFDPTGPTYLAACGSVACSITINGTVWGDGTLGAAALAGLVTLDAASSIDETPATAMIGATTLTGFAGWHANLSEVASGATAASVPLNQIGTLGAFSSNNFADDAQGFSLRDGRALTVTGPVQDFGTSASHGIAIALMGGAGTTYTAVDLLLQGNITASQTSGAVSLQATGNIVQSAGSITTASLIAEAGAIPGTEASGTQPGTIAASPVLTTGSIILPDQNQISALGGGGLGVSAEDDIRITNVPSLAINGTIVSANGTIALTNTGDVTNNSTVNAMTQDVTITSQQSIDNLFTIEAQNNVFLGAGGNIGNSGLIHAITQDATLLAGNAITNTGLVWAGNHVYSESGRTVVAGSIGNQGTIQADGIGSIGTPSIDLIALNGGNITQTSTGTTTATAVAGPAVITMNANANVTLDGLVLATGTQGLIGITANDAFNQLGGTIAAGGAGTSGTPSIAITANTGTIGQAAGSIVATNSAGYVGLTANTLNINTSGTIEATGTDGVVNLTAGRAITQSGGLIEAGTPGDTLTAGRPIVGLLAQGGTIAQTSSSAAILANNNAGAISVISTASSITTAGSIIAAGSSAEVYLSADSSVTQSNGTILSGGVETSGAPNLSITANTGTIGQSATGSIIASNTNNGYIALDAQTLDISTAGTIQATGTAGVVALTAHGAITQSGTGLIEAGTVGDTTTAGTPNVTLVAQTGTIGQTATTAAILANNNAGTIGMTASASSIATAGNVIAAGTSATVGLTAGTSITQSSGTIRSGGPGTIASSGSVTPSLSLLANGGTIQQGSAALISATNTAGVVGLHATGNIDFAGSILAPGSLSSNTIPTSVTIAGISLVSTGGSITETPASGVMEAGLLVGSANGAVSLNGTSGTGNLIANLGSFTAAGGDFSLTDEQNLTVLAAVMSNKGSVVITDTHLGSGTASSLTNQSTIQGPTGVTLTADLDLTNNGTIMSVNNDVVATATQGTLTNNALISAAHDALLTAGADIDNNLNATITAGRFAILNAGTSINDIGTILAAGTGSASAPSISLTAQTGTIDQPGSGTILASDTTGVISLDAMAAGQDITLDGLVSASGTLGLIAMTAGGAVTQNSGTIVAGGPSGSGVSSVTIAATGGTIGQAAGGTILATNSSGLISLNASSDIDASGSIGATGSAGTVDLTAGGSVNQLAGTILANGSGTINASGAVTPNLALTANGGTIDQSAGAVITAGNPSGMGVIALHATGAMMLDGSVLASGTGSGISLVSTGGSIVQAAASGILQAGTLVGSAADGAILNGVPAAGNQVANLGSFATGSAGSGDFVLIDEQSLSVIAPVIANAGSVVITDTHIGAGTPSSLTNQSTIRGQTGITLAADVNVTNSGTIQAVNNDLSVTAGSGTLGNSGLISGAQNATLSASTNLVNTGTIQAINQEATLNAEKGTLNTSGTVLAGNLAALSAVKGANLSISGVLNAPTITVNAGPNQVTIGTGTTITTSGTIRVTGPTTDALLPSNPLLPPVHNPRPGAYFSAGNFQQVGNLTLVGIGPENSSILRIDVSNGGPITFGATSGSGLYGSGTTWLIVKTSGAIRGPINVKALDVSYNGTTGGAELTGLVNNYTGHAAAGVSNIEQTKNARYRINGCPIGSVNCVLLPSEGVPTANPLDEIFLGSFFSQQDEADLLLPIVSDQDY